MPKRTIRKNNSDLSDILIKLGNKLTKVLEEKNEKEYFQFIVLNYTFIENILQYSIFLKISWMHADEHKIKNVNQKIGFNKTKQFCEFFSRLQFYQTNNFALALDLIDYPLFCKIEKIRKDRNNFLHQLWLYENIDNSDELRETLKELVEISSKLVEKFLKLAKEIGVSEIYDTTIFFK
jgi:hypothetical protein